MYCSRQDQIKNEWCKVLHSHFCGTAGDRLFRPFDIYKDGTEGAVLLLVRNEGSHKKVVVHRQFVCPLRFKRSPAATGPNRRKRRGIFFYKEHQLKKLERRICCRGHSVGLPATEG